MPRTLAATCTMKCGASGFAVLNTEPHQEQMVHPKARQGQVAPLCLQHAGCLHPLEMQHPRSYRLVLAWNIVVPRLHGSGHEGAVGS
eukprot:1753518-Amphidinium_carterae.1